LRLDRAYPCVVDEGLGMNRDGAGGKQTDKSKSFHSGTPLVVHGDILPPLAERGLNRSRMR
jgi:hypothetical protein